MFFLQARAIYDLAKKAFHVLKTNPKNIEVEFPVNRRRSMRRLQNEARDTRHVIPEGALDVSSKNIGLGPSVPSTYRRSSKERPLLCTKDAAPIDSAFLLGKTVRFTRVSLIISYTLDKYSNGESNSWLFTVFKQVIDMLKGCLLLVLVVVLHTNFSGLRLTMTLAHFCVTRTPTH